MRSTEDRDAHSRLPGHARFHVDLCEAAQRGIAERAQVDQIPHTAAMCRLLFYGHAVALLAEETVTTRRGKPHVSFDVDDDGELLVVVRRPAPRRWRTWFRVGYAEESLRFRCPGPHTDSRLVIE